MTVTAMADLIGKNATYRPARTDFDFLVKIIDARPRFGNVDVLITPVSGHGQQWVSRDSVSLARDVSVP